jgi:hypothetical protein
MRLAVHRFESLRRHVVRLTRETVLVVKRSAVLPVAGVAPRVLPEDSRLQRPFYLLGSFIAADGFGSAHSSAAPRTQRFKCSNTTSPTTTHRTGEVFDACLIAIEHAAIVEVLSLTTGFFGISVRLNCTAQRFNRSIPRGWQS